jgi:putative Mg2+ transporter-C (MgtC) family protein
MITVSEQLSVLLDIVIAAVLSGAIGSEREKLEKPAGLRTNMIIGSISCFLVAISPSLSNFIAANVQEQLRVDPIRILQAIIIGISFIGAGTILKSQEQNTVKNLTTASVLLYSTGIGISVALHAYVIALGLTLLGLIINSLNHSKTVRSMLTPKDGKFRKKTIRQQPEQDSK